MEFIFFFFSFSGNILRFSLFPWCLKVNENGSWCRYIFHLLQTGYSLNVFNLETQVLKFWENLFYFFNQFFLSVFFVFVVKLLFNQILGLLRRKSNIFFHIFYLFVLFCFLGNFQNLCSMNHDDISLSNSNTKSQMTIKYCFILKETYLLIQNSTLKLSHCPSKDIIDNRISESMPSLCYISGLYQNK